MNRLRSIHLLLGCFFAPLILFFAVSGLWQVFGVAGDPLRLLSTLHTLHQPKDGSGLASPVFALLVVLMALSWIATASLGVVLALRHTPHRRRAVVCIGLGIVVPAAAAVLGRLG
jgi:hypothetical protein